MVLGSPLSWFWWRPHGNGLTEVWKPSNYLLLTVMMSIFCPVQFPNVNAVRFTSSSVWMGFSSQVICATWSNFVCNQQKGSVNWKCVFACLLFLSGCQVNSCTTVRRKLHMKVCAISYQHALTAIFSLTERISESDVTCSWNLCGLEGTRHQEFWTTI